MAGVLVTRPEPEADALAAELEARGHTPLVEPLLSIRIAEPAPLDIAGVQALVFTSVNGVRAVAARTDVRNICVFAVGSRTAAAAREAGFVQVMEAGGDGRQLADLLSRDIDPARGALLHVSGAKLAVDLAELLAPKGITVHRVVGYEAVAAEALSLETLAALDQGSLSHVLFFSPRTARTFVSLLDRADRRDAARTMVACCLSEAVAKAVGGPSWRSVRIAAARTADAVLALVANEERTPP